MKKLFKLLLTVIFIVAIIYFAPKFIHKCDSCDTWFFGTGYEANIIMDAVSDDNQTICEECAKKHHLIETTFGKPLEDYKKKIFE